MKSGDAGFDAGTVCCCMYFLFHFYPFILMTGFGYDSNRGFFLSHLCSCEWEGSFSVRLII